VSWCWSAITDGRDFLFGINVSVKQTLQEINLVQHHLQDEALFKMEQCQHGKLKYSARNSGMVMTSKFNTNMDGSCR
jgi:hypothetical protein